MSNKVSPIKKIYHAAIYLRLSKEDGDVAASAKSESNSITNQKYLIKEFLKDKKDIVVVSERIDDGYSGSNFDRPAFQMMIEDIKKGIVDCVVVKDLSRFGREYIDSGRYIERLFPALGVRFIAINDNYDSAKGKAQSDEIIIPFKNLMNDAYCRDISIKIRSHLEVKRKNGEFIGAFVAYGYQKSEEDKHVIVPDPYAAEVVKEIFRMKLHGMSQDAIARELNRRGILSPAEYKASHGSNYTTSFKINRQAKWSSVTVRRILENEIYTGTLIQGKQTTPNHKIKQVYLRPEEEWIRIENHHEAIISRRDFDIVQRLLGLDTRTSPKDDAVAPLAGIVVCADCGMPMSKKITSCAGKKYEYYVCSTYKTTKECSSHRIPVQALEEAVLQLLQQHVGNILDMQRILDYISLVPFQELDMKRLEKQKEAKEKEVERYKELRTMLYEDMKDGIVTKEDYIELHDAYDKKRKAAEEAIRHINAEIESVVEAKNDKYEWLSYFTKYQDVSQLTRVMVVELIRKIHVMDKNNIEIEFDFDDCYQDALRRIEDLGYCLGDIPEQMNMREEAI